ncbi:hypothetical protein TIFTF001_016919 [Ficus carica]|uniref:Uncharacterized protein n=1 Tax=Ficus carica TaxID=3494 RepID=A0AA88AKC4_FICCA|nr:hypothetical protein TIFTF001_016919 [Ficus carica]
MRSVPDIPRRSKMLYIERRDSSNSKRRTNEWNETLQGLGKNSRRPVMNERRILNANVHANSVEQRIGSSDHPDEIENVHSLHQNMPLELAPQSSSLTSSARILSLGLRSCPRTQPETHPSIVNFIKIMIIIPSIARH